jgi:hypothetical protein
MTTKEEIESTIATLGDDNVKRDVEQVCDLQLVLHPAIPPKMSMGKSTGGKAAWTEVIRGRVHYRIAGSRTPVAKIGEGKFQLSTAGKPTVTLTKI